MLPTPSHSTSVSFSVGLPWWDKACPCWPGSSGHTFPQPCQSQLVPQLCPPLTDLFPSGLLPPPPARPAASSRSYCGPHLGPSSCREHLASRHRQKRAMSWSRVGPGVRSQLLPPVSYVSDGQGRCCDKAAECGSGALGSCGTIKGILSRVWWPRIQAEHL